jgi:hypothetical protein
MGEGEGEGNRICEYSILNKRGVGFTGLKGRYCPHTNKSCHNILRACLHIPLSIITRFLIFNTNIVTCCYLFKVSIE